MKFNLDAFLGTLVFYIGVLVFAKLFTYLLSWLGFAGYSLYVVGAGLLILAGLAGFEGSKKPVKKKGAKRV